MEVENLKMSVSYTKRLKNEMESLEIQSDKFIAPEKYYIVKIHINGEYQTKNIGKIFLAKNPSHTPLVSYVFSNEVCLIFSCVNEESHHYLDGSHQKIISEYASYVSIEISSSACVNIIEFESQTQIISYLIWKIFTNSQIYATIVSDGRINIEDMSTHTQTEIIEKLQSFGIDWESVPNENKYGIFLKLKKEKNTYIVSTLSEYFDARNSQKYVNYIFGSCT